jgi:hypothetical protein
MGGIAMVTLLSLLFFGAAEPAAPDMWALAQRNADVLRISTLFPAQQVPQDLATDAGIDRAIAWCRTLGITHVYIESFRTGAVPPREMLAHARDRFREAGFLVSGCITPAGYGKPSTGWSLFSCYTSPETQRVLREMSQYAAGLFDEVMIDDFLATDCQCDSCRAAKGDRSWADFRTDLMLELSRAHIIEAGRAVNPNVQFIIKYPCWHESFQERGYDVDRQSQLFPKTWVGTETRGTQRTGAAEPQYRAYWLMRWLMGIGQEKCGGGWYDTIDTAPLFYLEQGRQTVLGGAREAFLFNAGALMHSPDGQADAAALRKELPLHFELARLIQGEQPRGLLGWKPMNSPAERDGNLHSLLGMAGFPVTAAHEFDADAPGYVFGAQALYDPQWPAALNAALRSGRPVLATPSFAEQARQQGAELAGLDQVLMLPALPDPNRYAALEAMPAEALDALRDRACLALGVTFHAPARVALYLFGDDVAVVENFRDEPVRCELGIEGWKGFQSVLVMPAGSEAGVSGGNPAALVLPPRSLLAVRRSD